MKKAILFFVLIFSFLNGQVQLEDFIQEDVQYFDGKVVTNISANSKKMFMVQGDSVLYRNEGEGWLKVFSSERFATAYDSELIIVEDNKLFAIKNNQIFTSNDYGDTWTSIANVPSGISPYGYVSFVMRNNDLYFSIYENTDQNNNVLKYFKLDFETKTWIPLPLNNTTGYAYYYYPGFTYQEYDFPEQHIYDGNAYYFTDIGFFKQGYNAENETLLLFSEDEGLTWNTKLVFPPNHNLVTISSDGKTMVGPGMTLSTDYGNTFIDMQNIPANIISIKIYGDLIIVDTGYKGRNGQATIKDGLYYCSVDDVSFKKLNDGLSFIDNTMNRFLNFSALNDGIFIGYQHGFRKVAKDNSFFIDVNNGVDNFIPKIIDKIDVDNTGRVYVYNRMQGLFITVNNGKQWFKDKNLMDQYAIFPYTISATNNNTIYACGYDPGIIHKSIDGGGTFVDMPFQFSPFSVNNIFADAKNDKRLTAVSTAPDGISYGTVFFPNIDEGQNIIAAVDKSLAKDVLYYDENTVLLTFDNKLLKTINNGVSWESIPTQYSFNRLISTTDAIYAIDETMFYQSYDLGKTWVNIIIPSEIANILNIEKIELINGNSFLILSTDKGIYLYDKNTSWNRITDKIYPLVKFNSFTQELILAKSNGAKKISFSFLNNMELSFEKNTIKIFPNPTSDFAEIDSAHNIISLELYDMQGKLIKTQKGNGKKEKINLAHYHSGVYIVKIVTQKEVKTIKVIKK